MVTVAAYAASCSASRARSVGCSTAALMSLLSTSRPWLRISSVKLSNAPTRLVGRRSAAKVPRPWRRTTIPSPARAPIAWRTVIRATPYRAARSVSDGSRSPAAHSPTVILILRSSRMLT